MENLHQFRKKGTLTDLFFYWGMGAAEGRWVKELVSQLTAALGSSG